MTARVLNFFFLPWSLLDYAEHHDDLCVVLLDNLNCWNYAVLRAPAKCEDVLWGQEGKVELIACRKTSAT